MLKVLRVQVGSVVAIPGKTAEIKRHGFRSWRIDLFLPSRRRRLNYPLRDSIQLRQLLPQSTPWFALVVP